jgi:hypothetical protein
VALPFLVAALIPLAQVTAAPARAAGRSLLTARPGDPKAVYLTREHFNVAGDGVKDDTAALQAAIDLAEEQSGSGIVFVPEGTYRLTRKVYLWVGIRLIGYGADRPTFKLSDHTPGYQQGAGKYMIHFVYSRPDNDKEAVEDGNWSTHYSEINNINFEIGRGNPAAIAVRFNVAQGSNLKNIDFNLGSGLGGIEEMGNIVECCIFNGGQWGIKTGNPPAGWQCTVMDCTFQGQREACLITQDAGMTVIRGKFKDAPIGISAPGNEKLFVTDTWFENMNESAVRMNSYTALQVNLDRVRCANVPYSVRFEGRIQGAKEGDYKMDYEAPGPQYEIKTFSHGLHIENPSGSAVTRAFTTKQEQSVIGGPGRFADRDHPALPDQNTWINILNEGAKGDGVADDTAALEKAVAKGETIYLPTGKYLLSRPVMLRNRTKLVGLHPVMTRFVVADGTAPFTDLADPKPLLETGKGGANAITGIGFNLGNNPGMIGLKWTAGASSYVDDVQFVGRDGRDCQLHSILVTDGGGGTFKNMWIVDWRTKLPFVIRDTASAGKLYQVSIEHHHNIELKLDNVKNWSFYALQTEEFRGNEKTLPIYIKDSSNLLFANLICYRTTGVLEPYFTAVQMRNSGNITVRGNWMRSGGPFPFDNSFFDEGTGMTVCHREFTRLDIR